MDNLKRTLIFLLLLCSPCSAQPSGGGTPTALFQELDGSPSIRARTIIVPNSTIISTDGTTISLDIVNNVSADASYWHKISADVGLTGDKTGSFDLTTSGLVNISGYLELTASTGAGSLFFGGTQALNSWSGALGSQYTQMFMGLYDSFILCEKDDINTNWGHSAVSNPVLYIQSALTTTNRYLRLYHDQTDARIETGFGSINFGTGNIITSGTLGAGATTVTSLYSPTIIGGTATTSDLALQTTSGIGAAGADMHFLVGNNGATEAMTILNSGNVGIGTTAPGRKLEVVDTGDAGQIRLTRNVGATYVDLGVDIIGANYGFAAFANGVQKLQLNTNGGLSIGTYAATTEAPSDGMIIPGNVGIGQETPTAVLHLKAGTAVANTQPLKFNTGTALTTPELGAIGFTDPDFYMYLTDTTVKQKYFIFNDGTKLTSGRVPIATTNGRLFDDAGMTFLTDTLTVTKVSSSGSHTFTSAASGIIFKQGANGRCGTFVANGVTPVTISNTSVAISDAIIISLKTVGGTVGVQPHIATITAGTGFTVICTALDSSTYNYAIIKNAA